MGQFTDVTITHISRGENESADALSKLAKEETFDAAKPIVILEVPTPSITREAILPVQQQHEAGAEWFSPILNYLRNQELPEDDRLARKIKRWSLEFSLAEGVLYKKGFATPWLTCVSDSKGIELLQEAHEGICGSHQASGSLAKRILRAGFFWPTMASDAESIVRRCEKCQLFSRVPRAQPAQLRSISSAWPFDLWGMDIVGPFPQARAQLKFVVVAIDYFTKWVEAKALATISSPRITDFFRKQVVYRYGIPNMVISDNGTQFTGSAFQDFCKGLNITMAHSSVCHPQTNGLVEVSNRTIVEGIRKKIEQAKGEWPELLEEVLWAYRTTPRTATGRSPFSMVYGTEAMTPLEMVHPTIRNITYDPNTNAEARGESLEFVYELREQAAAKMAEYQRKMRRTFDRTIAPRHFQPGDLVLRNIEATGKTKGKLDPNWEGPFTVVRSFGSRAYKLKDNSGKTVPGIWATIHLRKFYP